MIIKFSNILLTDDGVPSLLLQSCIWDVTAATSCDVDGEPYNDSEFESLLIRPMLKFKLE